MMTKVTDAQALTASTLDHYDTWEAPAVIDRWKEVRNQAVETLREANFPEARAEEYKFTNFSKALQKHFSVGPATTAGNVTLEDIAPFFIPELDADRIVLINGQYRSDLSVLTDIEGITIDRLAHAAEKQTEIFQEVFGQVAHAEVDAFTALNTVFATDGAFITVSRNADIERPIAIYNFVDARQQAAQAYPRVLIHAEQGSRSQFISSVHTLGDHPSLNASVTEAWLHANAEVNLVKVQNDSGDLYHYDHTEGYQSRDSRFTATTVSLRGTMVRNNLNLVLDDQGIESNMYGLTLLKGNQHVDHHTVMDHKKPHCESNELYKTILDEKSTGVFNGKIFVRPDAQKTNAFQSNNTILLSDDATIHAKPQLEIWADDVKCSHGATTGQMDEDQLFYLRARGLGENQAKALLLNAFAKDSLSLIPQDAVRNYLEIQIAERLNAI
ncbi:MAG TPA: Fe-S cluster assembly protein SufD [Cytophagales bacterium]|nr:Fe-S cluster assembly protein SufD [Cytophagales bacterium]HAP59193.1 Fe-S cluster assembly protein SufD [Cytophagales bacterium]